MLYKTVAQSYWTRGLILQSLCMSCLKKSKHIVKMRVLNVDISQAKR